MTELTTTSLHAAGGKHPTLDVPSLTGSPAST